MKITATGQINTVMTFSMPSVTLKSKGPPSQVSTGSLPLMFVRNVKITNEGRTLGYTSGSLSPITFEICILIEAVRQGNQDDSYDRTRSMMDELQAALEANAEALRLDSYSVYETFESGSDTTAFYAVVGEISTS